jgi:hypothetical protein
MNHNTIKIKPPQRMGYKKSIGKVERGLLGVYPSSPDKGGQEGQAIVIKYL